jgi:sugar lactone lactonase YvrE
MKTKSALDQVVKHAMELINANENSAIEKITKIFESIRSIVTKHENELKQKIRAIEKRNRDQVEKLQKQLKTQQEKLNKSNQDFQDFLSNKDYTKLLLDHQQSLKDLKTTTERLNEVKYPIKTEYRIEQIDQLQSTIADILQQGDVKCILSDISKDSENAKNTTAPMRGCVSSKNIPLDAKWNMDRITVAGGNRQGNKFNQFNGPAGLYVDDDETIYVADCNNHRVMQWKYGAKRGTIAAGGRMKGDGTHQLNRPYDVILDKKNDSLIISDNGNSRVVRWSRRNHTTSGEVLVSNVSCTGLTMDENGLLYVADQDKHEVRRYEIGDTKGTLVAGGNGKGSRLDQLHEPWYIFLDQDHSLYISDWGNHRVMKWRRGATQGIVVAGGNGLGNSFEHLHSPDGVVVDQLGTVYVADSRNDRVMSWQREATHGKVIIGRHRISCPVGLSFDRHSNLYIVDWGNHRVQRFSLK